MSAIAFLQAIHWLGGYYLVAAMGSSYGYVCPCVVYQYAYLSKPVALKSTAYNKIYRVVI